MSREKYVQGVRCNESRTIKMFVGDHMKCPQFRNSESYFNTFEHFIVVSARDLPTVLNSGVSARRELTVNGITIVLWCACCPCVRCISEGLMSYQLGTILNIVYWQLNLTKLTILQLLIKL